MILGVHHILSACGRRSADFVSSDGGMFILLMNGLLLIPVAFAAFFYPWQTLMGVGAFLLTTFAIYEVACYWRTHHLGPIRFWRPHS